MITNNINFKGFKNVFCAFDVPVASNQSATFLSMQLNDDDDHNDLTEYKKIKNMQGDIINEKYGDVLTVSYLIDKNKKVEHIYMDSKEMYWGDELLALKEKYVPKMMSKEQYQREEALHMKAYTLIASLTKRMQFAAFDNEDKDRIRVIERMYHTLWSIVKKQEDAFRLTEIACLKKIKFQDLAIGFNNGIAKTMARFFK